MRVLGISGLFHDAACCLLEDGRLVAAAQEERFSRRKGDPRLPAGAMRYCLEHAGLHPAQLDAVAYYERPERRRQRQTAWGGTPTTEVDPLEGIRRWLGIEAQIATHSHHTSHAASSFLYSPFDRAAIFTADGVGEWATTTYAIGDGERIERIAEVTFPHSLGLLYAAVTSWLGFPVLSGEGTVMGLAAWGEPRFMSEFRRLLRTSPGPAYELDLECFDFRDRMFSATLSERLGAVPRHPDEPVGYLHMDVAASLQALVEEVLLEKLSWLRETTGERRLCLAGGVALNSVANGRIAREAGFDEVFVPPAPSDAGGALGAAALTLAELETARPEPLVHAFLGPRFDPRPVLASMPLSPLDFRDRWDDLVLEVATRLARGQVVGWFHGRMELGPRALGARSILADPRPSELADRLNGSIKNREWFRPFALSVREERRAACLELARPSPFMSATCRTTTRLPAATHIDGTTRPQTVDARHAPRFADLLRVWEESTGCPALLNTSFNGRGEPIVCTPVDALLTASTLGLDAVVLEDWVIDTIPPAWRDLAPAWDPPRSVFSSRNLYTF